MSGVFEQVWALVRQIPPGRVTTYGQLAQLIGRPRGARLVGYAMSACPSGSSVPCHRVVNRFGGTTTAFDTLAPGTQRALLEAEGVAFTPEGCVDLSRHLWQPPGR
ncbi:methylated-DNA--[protein]-cysteine S-methyltransferase [Oscillibacter sp. MSJ-2]|uniref:Methylated-DNA--[protein]-cysteine S-methyltransferase n=1 Tax=Dysosmobacter acutus TaxID=2841504 RepID=A0ABS6FAJ9_9FIRM|nr:MGMT family protein [Dysosmobacter acutus]MBU5626572.1 methylated-DNA--[protein]-cysteine S-methyltransferase [Dysosmobacter acutus]